MQGFEMLKYLKMSFEFYVELMMQKFSQKLGNEDIHASRS